MNARLSRFSPWFRSFPVRCFLLLAPGLLLLPLRAAEPPADVTPLAAADSESTTPNEIIAQSQSLIKRSDFGLAKQVLDKLLKRPNVDRAAMAEAVFLRARVAQQTDEPTNALIWYERYLDNYPDQTDAPYAVFLMGQIYKQIGAYDRARESFYKTLSFAIKKASSLALDDFSSSVRLTQAAAWELAETEYLAKNWDRADELYERFKKQNPAMDGLINTACYRQADISFQLKRPKEAIARYETALAAAPFHPFSTEAWLRLVSLYGMTGDKDKQATAMQSFIWTVNTLEKQDQLYWQRRLADQLLAEYKGHLPDQIPLLETIMKFQSNESWMRMLDFYLALLDRQADHPDSNLPQPSQAAGDNWNEWRRGFRDRLDKIVEQLETMRNTDTAQARPPATSPQ